MTGDGRCAQVRLDLGVYVLGAIEPVQRACADRHLAACPQCRAELAGLAGLPALLRKVPAAEAQQLSRATPGAAGLPLSRAVTAQAVNPATGARAVIGYTAEPWGTELEVRVTGVAAGTRCQFWVTGPRGQEVAAGGWTIAAGHQAAWYPAAAPFPPASVRSFTVTAGGKALVTVAAR